MEVFSLNTASGTNVPKENEEKASLSLAESLQPNQKTGTSTNPEKKKRTYTKKPRRIKTMMVLGKSKTKND
jgi:hypothetical protein